MNLFVYGTLQSDYHNNPVLSESGGKFISTGWTNRKFVLRDCGFPFLIPPDYDNAEPLRVVGEVWQMKDLSGPDSLEGHPDWYIREEEVVHTPYDSYVCWVYKMKACVRNDLCGTVDTTEETFYKWRDNYAV